MIVSLKLNRDFQRAYKKGTYKAGRFLVVYARKNGSESNRLGIATGKRFGNSVQRNRVKRLIRESFRAHSAEIASGYDIVVMTKASERVNVQPGRKMKAVSVPVYSEIDGDIVSGFKRLGLLL